MTVVALNQRYAGHSKQAGLIASQCSAGIDNNRLTVVVDEHVEITSLQDVIWAILARSDPMRSVDIIGGTKGSRIDVAIAPVERHLGVNSRMVIDATTPFHWRDDPMAGTSIYSKERGQATLDQWGWLLESDQKPAVADLVSE